MGRSGNEANVCIPLTTIMVSIMTVGYKKNLVRGDETRTSSSSSRRYTDSRER